MQPGQDGGEGATAPARLIVTQRRAVREADPATGRPCHEGRQLGDVDAHGRSAPAQSSREGRPGAKPRALTHHCLSTGGLRGLSERLLGCTLLLSLSLATAGQGDQGRRHPAVFFLPLLLVRERTVLDSPEGESGRWKLSSSGLPEGRREAVPMAIPEEEADGSETPAGRR